MADLSMPASIHLGEGRTPLVDSVAIGASLGAKRLHFKMETVNPSGSYKDRFAAIEVAWMREQGVTACVATSSGNTGSALAAYCARAGIRCFIVVNPEIPPGKLVQMRAHGAQVIAVRGFITSPSVTAQVFDVLGVLVARHQIPVVISAYRYSPRGMAGVESLGMEIAQQCEGSVDHVFVPVGGGGLYSAVCHGLSRAGARPRVHAVQPAGCLTVVAAWQRGDGEVLPVESTTRVSGLSVPFDIDGSLALSLLRENNGCGIAVSDEEVFAAQARLFTGEGINCEPAGAAALAGFLRAFKEGLIAPGDRCVCVVTGHGFKDPASMGAIPGAKPLVSTEAGDLADTLRQLTSGAGIEKPA
jgi:threonine synthase